MSSETPTIINFIGPRRFSVVFCYKTCVGLHKLFIDPLSTIYMYNLSNLLRTEYIWLQEKIDIMSTENYFIE